MFLVCIFLGLSFLFVVSLGLIILFILYFWYALGRGRICRCLYVLPSCPPPPPMIGVNLSLCQFSIGMFNLKSVYHSHIKGNAGPFPLDHFLICLVLLQVLCHLYYFLGC